MKEESNQRRPKPRLELIPHHKAPLFGRSDALLVLQQLVSEMSSGNFPTSGAFQEYVRQAGFVCLWFFGKCIAGIEGEYDKLDDDVHLDMCNFRQRLLGPGTRGAMFLPRGVGKSKIVTELGTAWELSRVPGERFRVSNAIADFAQDFMLSIKAIFESEVFTWLYPENHPQKNQKRWNDKEIVVPGRRKHSRMASVEYGGVGGAAASHHFTCHVVDDMISEQSLNSMRASNALMEHTKHWFWTNAPSLLDDTLNSRIIVVGTRYAVDDVYDDILKRTRTFEGYPIRGVKPNPSGQWSVYYRKIVEDDQIIFPLKHSFDSLADMAENDYWTYVTQYLNDPKEAGLAEFVQYDVRLAEMSFHDDEWWVLWRDGEEDFEEPLSVFDVIQCVDPAGTERYISAKTSRSAVGVVATHWTGRKFLIDLKVDYVAPHVMFDWIFANAKKWGRYLRSTFLESNGPFRVLQDFLRREQEERGIWIGLQPFASVGEKEARIRNDLDPEFAKGNLFTLASYVGPVKEEAEAFPQSMKKDILDMLSAACRRARQPMSPDEAQEAAAEDDWFIAARNRVVGY